MALYSHIILIILITFLSACKHEQTKQATSPSTVIISKTSSTLNIGSHISYVATDINLDLATLLANEKTINWQLSPSDIPVLPTSDQSYWLKFKAVNTNNEIAKKYLTYNFPLLNEIEIYSVDEAKNKISHINSASLYEPISKRSFPHRNYIFPISIGKNTQLTYYLKIVNDSVIQVPINIFSPTEFHQHDGIATLWLGITIGFILLTSLYSIFMYSATKDACFAYYALYAITYIFFYLGINGIGHQYIWTIKPIASQAIMLTSSSLCLACICLFNISFINAKKNAPKIYKSQITFVSACLLFSVSSWFISEKLAIELLIILVICMSSLSMCTGFISWQQQQAQAGKYFLSWLALGLGSFIFILGQHDYIFNVNTSSHILTISQLLSFLLLLAALSVKLKQEKLALVNEMQKAIEHYQVFYNIYEHAVEAHYTTTEKGKIIRVNNAFLDLVGYSSSAELLKEKPYIKSFYLQEEDRRKLVKQAKEEQKILGFDCQWRKQNGREIWVSINLRYAQSQLDGNVLIGSIVDVTEKKRAEQHLEFIANHDPLTGLFNRREFEKRLNDALFTCDDEHSHTLLFMDLDQFKIVNDTCGHKAGDMLLRQLTDELQDAIEGKGILSRFGGDEFGVLLENKIGDEAFVIAYQLKQIAQDFRFLWDNKIFTIGASIGMVEINQHTLSIDQALSIADTACFTAKEKGRNRIHAYTSTDKDIERHHKDMEQVALINEALEHDRFFLEYQTITPINKVEELNYEVLIRMKNRDGGRLAPFQFLPAAERYNLMAAIDRWVINHYFNWLSQHPDHLNILNKCSINLSGPSLADEGMQLYILKAFEQYRIPYNKICFEITESLAITQLDKTLAFIQTFKKLGCLFSLDDFGSGFSSYGYLKNLPVDYLKIDGSFVKDMMIDPIDKAMVKSINEVAKAIGMITIAEFVESGEILAELKLIGVDYAQGYHIDQPQALDTLLNNTNH